MKNTVIKFGLIGGGIISILMLVNFQLMSGDGSMDMRMGEVLGYTSMLIALSSIFFGVRSYRDNTEGGIISFGKAFKVGIYITLIAAAMYVLTWMIYSNTVATDFMDQYLQYSIEEIKNNGGSAEEIEAQIESMKSNMEIYKNPFVQIIATFLEIFPVGILVSLICAAILKKK